MSLQWKVGPKNPKPKHQTMCLQGRTGIILRPRAFYNTTWCSTAPRHPKQRNAQICKMQHADAQGQKSRATQPSCNDGSGCARDKVASAWVAKILSRACCGDSIQEAQPSVRRIKSLTSLGNAGWYGRLLAAYPECQAAWKNADPQKVGQARGSLSIAEQTRLTG